MIRLFLSFLLIGVLSWGQDGTPDLSFGDDGLLIVSLGNNPPIDQAILWGVTENSSGNLLAYAEYNFGAEFHYIISILEDGSLDSSWGIDGLLELQGIDYPEENGILVQSDDAILIKNKNGELNGLYRYLPNGTLDLSFGTDSYLAFSNESYRFEVQLLDDYIYYLSDKMVGSVYTGVIEKYTPDGQLDTSFANGGVLEIPFLGPNSHAIHDIRLLDDGGFMIFFREDDEFTSTYRLMKLLPDGNLDADYGENGISEIIPVTEGFGGRTLLVYPDGASLTSFGYWDSTTEEYYSTLFKIAADGTIATDFGNQGEKSGLSAEFIQGNGRFIGDLPSFDWEGGYYMNYKRYFQDGYLDPSFTFQPPIVGALGMTYSLLLESGKLLIASSSIWYDPESNLIFQRLNNNPLEIPDFKSQQITVSPNPSDGLFQLKLNSFNQDMEYSIVDISGKQIQSGAITHQNATLDLSSFEAGMYFLHLGNTTLKLIKN